MQVTVKVFSNVTILKVKVTTLSYVKTSPIVPFAVKMGIFIVNDQIPYKRAIFHKRVSNSSSNLNKKPSHQSKSSAQTYDYPQTKTGNQTKMLGELA